MDGTIGLFTPSHDFSSILMKSINGIPPRCQFWYELLRPLAVVEYPVRLFYIKIPAVKPWVVPNLQSKRLGIGDLP